MFKEDKDVSHDYRQRVNFSDMVISTPETTAEHKFLARMADVDLCPVCSEEFLVWMANGESVEQYLNLDIEEKQDGQSDNMEDRS